MKICFFSPKRFPLELNFQALHRLNKAEDKCIVVKTRKICHSISHASEIRSHCINRLQPTSPNTHLKLRSVQILDILAKKFVQNAYNVAFEHHCCLSSAKS